MEPIRRSLTFNNDTTLSDLSRLKTRMQKAEDQASSGLEVRLPSDAPEIWIAISRLRAEGRDQQVYGENAERAKTWLSGAETALREATNLLNTVRERAIQLGSETVDADARTAAVSEIDQLRTDLLNLANTHVDGRYVFGGNAYDQPAFDNTGAYLGSAESPEAQIGRNSRLTVGFDGNAVFKGTVDAFQTLQDLSTALAANDAAGVRNVLTDVETAVDQAIAWWEEVGARDQAANDASDLATQLEYLSTQRLDAMISADPAESFSQLAELRMTYEATLQITAGANRQNLFQFIG